MFKNTRNIILCLLSLQCMTARGDNVVDNVAEGNAIMPSKEIFASLYQDELEERKLRNRQLELAQQRKNALQQIVGATKQLFRIGEDNTGLSKAIETIKQIKIELASPDININRIRALLTYVKAVLKVQYDHDTVEEIGQYVRGPSMGNYVGQQLQEYIQEHGQDVAHTLGNLLFDIKPDAEQMNVFEPFFNSYNQNVQHLREEVDALREAKNDLESVLPNHTPPVLYTGSLTEYQYHAHLNDDLEIRNLELIYAGRRYYVTLYGEEDFADSQFIDYNITQWSISHTPKTDWFGDV